ncbi:glutathione S-transferase family protein [Pseudomonas benzenivorans]|uniref:glutathione transferase n=1 Tax=Pseudomonas benzenivorans TaxID=556533 RepID=A0ABY5HCQ5_9PSED|nr:glutathione S-transferase family protein [Pseudomonas benzenivorans]UTW09050.1 glutathione S-transferase family protein [Pseudomonas benzenivorans]
MPTFKLISNTLCPYTQRAAILLAEKGIAFERSYIDLANKPDWFVRLSPLGKVPLLQVEDSVVFETAVICEYIEEATPSRPLFPADPLARAHQRGWAEFASAIIADIYGFYMAPDQPAFAAKCADLAARFRWLEQHLGQGPYFAGDDFGLVDAAFAPIFRLFDVFDEVVDHQLFEGLQRVAAYRAALAHRASVQAVVVADYPEVFRHYLRGRGSHLAGLLAEPATA